MSPFIYLAIGFLLGVVFAKRRVESQMRASFAPNAEEVLAKQENLDKILSGFSAGDEITNDKVEQMLGISDATAERYLDELERRGILKQVGRTGRFVTYKKY